MRYSILAAFFVTVSFLGEAIASDFPVTVKSCNRDITFEQAPKRAVIHDQNMSQMAFALGLQEHIIGLTGITGWYKTSPEFDKQRGGIPELAPKYPNMENILGAVHFPHLMETVTICALLRELLIQE